MTLALIVFCALVAFIVFSGALFALDETASEDQGGPGAVALLSLAACVLSVFAAWYFLETSKIRAGFELALPEHDQRSEPVVEHVSDVYVRELLEFNQQEARKYHANAQRQAQQAFRISQAAMVFGLVVLLVGAALTLVADNTAAAVSVAALSGAATAISGYVGATFLRSYSMSVAQTYRYFQQPLVTGFLLLADRMAQDIGDDAKKDEARAAMAAQIVRGAFGLMNSGEDSTGS